jgi:hypothetical protein
MNELDEMFVLIPKVHTTVFQLDKFNMSVPIIKAPSDDVELIYLNCKAVGEIRLGSLSVVQVVKSEFMKLSIL